MTDHDTLIIRPLTRGDEDAWRELWAGYLAFYSTTLGDKIYRTTFDRYVSEDEPDMRALVAEVEGELAGLAHMILHRHGWHIEKVMYLQDLFVARLQRQRGIARHLIDHVYKLADDIGCPSVYWTTQDFNVEARALYDQVGHLTPFVKYTRT